MDVLVAPYSIVYPDSGLARPGTFVGSTNGRREEGIEVEDGTALTVDAKVELRFQIPPTLASSPNAALRLRRIANAATGDAKVGVQWAPVAEAENPDTATLRNEGTQTLSWATGDAEEYLEDDVVLDATAALAQADAGKAFVVELTFEETGWTLAVDSYWWAFLKVAVS